MYFLQRAAKDLVIQLQVIGESLDLIRVMVHLSATM